MKINDIARIKPVANYILIKISGVGDTKTKLPGTNFTINTSYNPEHHTDPRGIVVAVPEFLEEFDVMRNSNFGCMPYHTELDVIPGDMVWFDYLTYLEALSDLYNPLSDYHLPKYIYSKGELYIFVHYSRLYMRKSDRGEAMLNGWLRVEHLISPRLIISGKKKYVPVRVTLSGPGNTNYRSELWNDPQIDAGQMVLLKRRFGIRQLESWEDESNEIREVCTAQLKDVMCIVDGDLQQLFKEEEIGEFKIQTLSGMQYAATAWTPKKDYKYQTTKKKFGRI